MFRELVKNDKSVSALSAELRELVGGGNRGLSKFENAIYLKYYEKVGIEKAISMSNELDLGLQTGKKQLADSAPELRSILTELQALLGTAIKERGTNFNSGINVKQHTEPYNEFINFVREHERRIRDVLMRISMERR
ncbi:MAG: hypothetical protein M1544_02035 [Candidatus Marsarchaeota archaeon]|nr:hypothetical protein [Candidatus Marsarchaeota archaeon]